MRILRKGAIAFLVAAIVICNTTVCALAADSTITFNSRKEGFAFETGSEYTQTDLFDNFKDVMPGDKMIESITVSNDAKDCDYIKLYMRAEAHDEESNSLTYSESFEAVDGKDQAGVNGQRDETSATMSDFLAQLSMKIYNGSKLIYEASLNETDGLSQNVLLSTFRRGEITTLTVEIEVPLDLGNEYANRVGEVDWIFTVEAFDDPVDEPQPEPTEDPVVITPPTGDNSHLGRYIVLLLICGVVLYTQKSKLWKRKKEA